MKRGSPRPTTPDDRLIGKTRSFLKNVERNPARREAQARLVLAG